MKGRNKNRRRRKKRRTEELIKKGKRRQIDESGIEGKYEKGGRRTSSRSNEQNEEKIDY